MNAPKPPLLSELLAGSEVLVVTMTGIVLACMAALVVVAEYVGPIARMRPRTSTSTEDPLFCANPLDEGGAPADGLNPPQLEVSCTADANASEALAPSTQCVFPEPNANDPVTSIALSGLTFAAQGRDRVGGQRPRSGLGPRRRGAR